MCFWSIFDVGVQAEHVVLSRCRGNNELVTLSCFSHLNLELVMRL